MKRPDGEVHDHPGVAGVLPVRLARRRHRRVHHAWRQAPARQVRAQLQAVIYPTAPMRVSLKLCMGALPAAWPSKPCLLASSAARARSACGAGSAGSALPATPAGRLDPAVSSSCTSAASPPLAMPVPERASLPLSCAGAASGEAETPHAFPWLVTASLWLASCRDRLLRPGSPCRYACSRRSPSAAPPLKGNAVRCGSPRSKAGTSTPVRLASASSAPAAPAAS